MKKFLYLFLFSCLCVTNTLSQTSEMEVSDIKDQEEIQAVKIYADVHLGAIFLGEIIGGEFGISAGYQVRPKIKLGAFYSVGAYVGTTSHFYYKTVGLQARYTNRRFYLKPGIGLALRHETKQFDTDLFEKEGLGNFCGHLQVGAKFGTFVLGGSISLYPNNKGVYTYRHYDYDVGEYFIDEIVDGRKTSLALQLFIGLALY